MALGIATLALLLAACGNQEPPPYYPGYPTMTNGGLAASLHATPTGTVDRLVAASLAPMGSVVTDGEGWVLYRSDDDSPSPSTSNCTGECATVWPPALTDGNPLVIGIPYQAVGVVLRPDGVRQLTLAGWPLYRYIGDTRPGEFNGQGVSGTWFVIAPSGEKNLTVLPTVTPTPVSPTVTPVPVTPAAETPTSETLTPVAASLNRLRSVGVQGS